MKYTETKMIPCGKCDGTGKITKLICTTGDKVRTLRNHGKSMTAIAKELQLPISTVWHHLNR